MRIVGVFIGHETSFLYKGAISYPKLTGYLKLASHTKTFRHTKAISHPKTTVHPKAVGHANKTPAAFLDVLKRSLGNYDRAGGDDPNDVPILSVNGLARLV